MTGAVRVAPPRRGLSGVFAVPGDKSIAHRALLLGALAEGTTMVSGFPGGADVLSTLGAVRALGAEAERAGDVVRVAGRGPALGPADTATIDCGNSGTTMRLVAGLAAGGPGAVVLDGDASLRRRPMERVAEPLRRMGAVVETTAGHAPLRVRGGSLVAVEWRLPVASAQVKSAVLLAGLRARGTTRVREPLASRDHTERLLAHFGAGVRRYADGAEVEGGQRLKGATVPLPGDASSAAFLVVAGLLVPGSEVRLTEVGVNPTRTGFLEILRRMGATIEVSAGRDAAGEPRADLVVRAVELRATTIRPEEVPATIDELPVLSVAAALAEGETTIAGAGELRLKESDRIAAVEQLRLLGVEVRTGAEAITIRGTGGRRLAGAAIATRGDHRIAMAFAVAGLVAEGGVTLDDAACADVSFPGFFARLAALGAVVEGACAP
jgi:3-phosphoshikimate 1-carboxyvinyltransferase